MTNHNDHIVEETQTQTHSSAAKKAALVSTIVVASLAMTGCAEVVGGIADAVGGAAGSITETILNGLFGL